MLIDIKINPERCKGCELCIANCPNDVLGVSNQPDNRSYFPVKVKSQENCTGCKNCAIICPDVCIEIYRL